MDKEEIKAIRNQLGLTQKQLADKLGVTHISVWKWEKGRAKPHKTFESKILELKSADAN